MGAKRHGLGNLFLLAGLVASPGCMTLCPKALDMPPECVQACHEVPCACRGKVCVFLIDGFDPFDVCGRATVRQALIEAGFFNVFDGHFYHTSGFADEMRQIHQEEPDTRFVVVGFSTGAESARSMCEAAAAEGIAVELLALVDGPLWSASVGEQPRNVGRTIHMPAGELAAQPLAEELAGIAVTIPTLQRELPPAVIEELPTPRPVAKPSMSPRDAWDFLKPVARLDRATTEVPLGKVHTTLREKVPEKDLIGAK